MTGTFSIAERDGCTRMLQLLSDSSLLSLHQTVTNSGDQMSSASDKIAEIISHSRSAEELLKRKKVQRDIIFKYLQNEGLVVDKNSDKPKLMTQALTHWFVAQNGQAPEASIQPERSQESIFPSMPTDNSFDTNLMTKAQQFLQQFYGLLNNLNPDRGQVVENLQPQHFWEDVKLLLHSSSGYEGYVGAELVRERFLVLARDEKFILNPNLEPHGYKALSTPHGLGLVAVAGTIHRDTAYLGIYEQLFGLIRCPSSDNNWKIKFTEVRINKSYELGVESGLAPPSFNWDPSDLQRVCSYYL